MNKEENKLELIENLIININEKNILSTNKELLILLKELECNELNFVELKSIISFLIMKLGTKHYNIDFSYYLTDLLDLIK